MKLTTFFCDACHTVATAGELPLNWYSSNMPEYGKTVHFCSSTCSLRYAEETMSRKSRSESGA